ncbi:hypothetical protein ACFQV2_18595 [Actinokineospora soli]|uniref:Peptidase C-terminal archaeal/bacterial domain-containing protein n=1 Tax=Actinokineospora soli TaxID=1048753 RepID=A0ABW2TQZ0_9PSEU
MGRSQNTFQVFPDTVFGGPYTIDTVGGSPNTNTGDGVWRFHTASGGPNDFVTAPAQEGLHAVAVHQVGWQEQFDTPFGVTLGGASVAPSAVDITSPTDSGAFDVTFTSSVDLDGLSAAAFGLSQPTTTTETATQDDPDDPSSASLKRDVAITNAARLTASTAMDTDDIDLFVVRDANGDGQFTNTEIVASSTTPASDESVELIRPADGAYQVWVLGWGVSGNPKFTLSIDAVQGTDLTVTGAPSGPLPAGTPVTLSLTYNRAMTPGESYFGALQLGPPSAPAVLSVPIRITRS